MNIDRRIKISNASDRDETLDELLSKHPEKCRRFQDALLGRLTKFQVIIINKNGNTYLKGLTDLAIGTAVVKNSNTVRNSV